MFCPNCGSKLPDDARFCGSCGTRLKADQPAPNPQKGKKKNGKKILIVTVSILLVLAIAAAAVLAWQLFFAKETVYLLVESTGYTEGNPMRSSISKEYDENGNLLRNERLYDYSDEYEDMGAADMRSEISYEYEDGVLAGMEITQNEQSIQLAYIYEKGVLADIELVESSQDDDLEVKIDDEGRILEMITLNGGDETSTIKFDYHENGVVREKVTSYTLPSGYRIVQKYDERGNTTEQTTYVDGEVLNRVVLAYSENGSLLEQTQYGEGNELYVSMKFIPEYGENGKMTELEISFKDDSDKGSVIFKAEYDGLELTLTPVDIRGSFDGEEEIPEDTRIIVTYDKAGNITETRIYTEGELYMKNVMEFKEFKVPKGYRKIANSDPFWFPLGS